MNSFTVRTASSADAATVAHLESQVFCDPWSEGSIISFTADPKCTVLISELGTTAVAYLIGSGVAGEYEILRIASSPEHRRLGAAGALLDSFIAARRGAGDEVLFLEVRKSNTAAQGLYLSRGFAPFAERRSYYKNPVEDAVLMRLDLGI